MVVSKRGKKRLQVMNNEKTHKFISKKQKQEKLPEDIFFSPRCVYYESDMEGITSGQYQVFTMYPSLYTEESDDDFWKLCNGIFYGLLQNSKVLIAVKMIDGSAETKNAVFQRLKEWKTRNQEAVILESDEGYQILCRADKMIFDFKQFEEDGRGLFDYKIYGYSEKMKCQYQEQAKQLITQYQYDIYLYYHKYPDYLEIRVKSNCKEKDLLDVIGGVCKENHRRLFVEYVGNC